MSRKGSIGSGSIASTSTISLSTNLNASNTRLQPCGASSQLVLQAQGSSILCFQHDSLVLERRFEGHSEDVVVLSVDNQSDSKLPRVVSIDASRTAIVWDLDNGEEISRYSSYEEIRAVSWMKNGNLTFGDSMGNVILFDPVRSESISARTIFDPLCAVAPSADCKTFALGYNNGSVLIVALSPSFTILHTLTTTSLAPSSITTLAWHASSSKQKSDMLAAQTRDGDLRVWSVPKSFDGEETARVVRVLKRPDGTGGRGNNWLGWSRNGRIVQYSDGTTTIWDVRTKNVTWEDVPTLDNVVGVCVYGPTGALFTFGRDNTAQQFSLYPPLLVTNIQHRASLPPPSPPASIEERRPAFQSTYPLEPLHTEQVHEMPRDDEYMSPTIFPPKRLSNDLEKFDMSGGGGLGISTTPKERAASVSSRSSGGSVSSRHKHSSSELTKGSSTPLGQETEYSPLTAVSPGAGRKGSIGAASQNSLRKFHPLRQEIHASPETPQNVQSPIAEAKDIFSNLSARMANVTYRSPRMGGPQNRLSEDDLRREMLFCVFGWRGDIESLVNDELESVNVRSLSALVLRMWLGDLDQNSLAVMIGADFSVSGDWLFIALSAMGGKGSWAHVMRAFVMKLLQKDDIHMAVLCLLSIGDKNDAVEVYVSHKRYLEAVLLTCLLWKKDWKRISQLVRKWGEYAADNHDSALAARCFACAGTEAPTERPSQPPSRTSHSRTRSGDESVKGFVRGRSISGPSNPRTTLRMTPKDSPLKLITSFPASPDRDPVNRSATVSPTSQVAGVNRFFSSGAPRSATSTPIAMSALTPIDPFWANNESFPPTSKTPAPAKLTPVTENSPADRTPIQRLGDQIPPPDNMQITSPIEARNSSGFQESKPITLGDYHKLERAPTPPPPLPPPPAQSPPPRRVASPATADPTLPGPRPGLFNKDKLRNEPPRGKPEPPRGKPEPPRGKPSMQIQWPPIDKVIREGTPKFGHRRKNSRNSPPMLPINQAARPKKGEDLDNFLSLLEKGQKRMDSQRATPRGTPQLRGESPPPERTYPRKMSVEEPERGRVAQIKTSATRSPSSPLPFSPQASFYREPVEIDSIEIARPPSRQADERGRSHTREPHASAFRSPSSPAMMSAEQAAHYRDGVDRVGWRDEVNYMEQRGRYMDQEDDLDETYYTSQHLSARNRSRGRSRVKEVQASHMRSPSSPLPMSPQAMLYQEMSAEVDRQHEMEERFQRRPTPMANTRAGSRVRAQPAHHRSPRRSRSARTLRQWSDELERTAGFSNYSYSRTESPAPSALSRVKSVRGLPANPRAWRADLQTSRANSPSSGSRNGSRARSPAMAPAPPRALTPNGHGRNMSPVSRTRSPASRKNSPAPVNSGNMRGRAISRPAPLENVNSTAIPRTTNQYYHSPIVAEYESIGMTPEIPPLPPLSRADSHKRNNSEPTFKPLITKLPPQPMSPPPLPQDLPVHPALQVHLEASQPRKGSLGVRGKTLRRAKHSDELVSPLDSSDADYGFPGQEQSIVVGLDRGDLYSQSHDQWAAQDYYHEMRQLRARHAKTPSTGSRKGSPALGSLNQF